MKYFIPVFAIALLLSSILILGCGEEETEENGGGANFPPKINEIRAYGTTIKQGASTPFKVLAEDFDGDSMEYTWEATAGQFDQKTGQSVVWTAPDTPGTAEVTVSATDNRSDPVTGTVIITVETDKGLETDIIGTWSLPEYKEAITLTKAAEDGEEEIEFTVNGIYNRQEYTYKSDGTHNEALEFQYIIPKSSGLPFASNIIECQANLTGTYSLSGSELTIDLPAEEITIETDYEESKYDDEQKALLDGYLEDLEEKIREKKSSGEPIEIISIENNKMEWTDNLSWEQVLVTVEFI